MSKSREEFEKYWIDRCSKKGIECVLVRIINGEYYNISAFYAYEGWKASREVLVIELPDATFETPSGDSALREDAVYEAIKSQGIKVITK